MAIQLKSERDANDNKYYYPEAYLRIYDVEVKASYDKVRICILVFGDSTSRNTDDSMSIAKIVELVSIVKFKPYLLKSGMDLKSAAYNYLKAELPQKYSGLDV